MFMVDSIIAYALKFFTGQDARSISEVCTRNSLAIFGLYGKNFERT